MGPRAIRARILPEGLRSGASMKSTDFGVLYPAMRERAKAMISLFGDILAGLHRDDRLTDSPHVSSGTPMTATSATAGCPKIAFSTSAG